MTFTNIKVKGSLLLVHLPQISNFDLIPIDLHPPFASQPQGFYRWWFPPTHLKHINQIGLFPQVGMNINIFQTTIKTCTLFDNSMVQFYGRESYANSSGKEYGKYGYNLESNLKWNPGKKSGRKKKSYHQIWKNQGYEHSESSGYLTNIFCLIKFSQIGWAGYPNLVGKCQMPTNLDLDFTFNSFWDLLDVKASYFCILVPFLKLFVHLNN